MKGEAASSAGQDPPPVVWVRPLLTALGLAVLFVLVLWHLSPVVMVLLGLLAAAAVASLLRPLVTRIPGPRGLIAALAELFLIGIIAGIGALAWWYLAGPIQEQFSRWPEMKDRLNTILRGWGDRLGIGEAVTVDSLLREALEFIGGTDSGQVAEILSQATEWVTTLLIWLAFIFFGSMYLLAEPPGRLRKPMLRLLPGHRREQMSHALDELEPKLRWWILGTFLSMSVVGVLAGFGFWIVGLEFWLALAILAAAGELVPVIGPAAAFLTALLFAAAQGGNAAIGVIVVWAVTQLVESNILIPLVMRQAVHMPPVVTVFTVVLWARALGPAGLLLAVPINLTIWTFVRHFMYSRNDLKRSEKDDSG
jgi:predicted PurR-regulated permease PerM